MQMEPMYSRSGFVNGAEETSTPYQRIFCAAVVELATLGRSPRFPLKTICRAERLRADAQLISQLFSSAGLGLNTLQEVPCGNVKTYGE